MLENQIQQESQPLAEQLVTPIDSHKPLKTSEQVAELLGIQPRTVRKIATEVKQAWYWLDDSQFKSLGKYTQFAVEQMLALQNFRNSGGIFSEWKLQIEMLNFVTTSPPTVSAQPLAPNPTSIVLSDNDQFYNLIQQELEKQKTAEPLTAQTLQLVEAELIDHQQEFSESEKQQREARRREIAQKAIQDAIADESDYQKIYLSARNQLRRKSQEIAAS